MGRVNTDSLLWICCCCGGIPFLGLLHGLIAVIPVTLGVTLCDTVIAIIYLPHDIWYTYYSVLSSSLIGINLKVLAFLLLPIPLLTWPISVFFACLLGSFVYGLFAPMVYLFDDSVNLCYGGIAKTVDGSIVAIKEFFKFNSKAYFGYLRDFRTQQLPEAGQPFDIKILEIFVGVIFAFFGVFAVGIPIAILSIIKFLPTLLRGYYYLWKLYFELKCGVICVLFIFWVLANLVLPAVAVLALVLVIISGFGVGVYTAWAEYKLGFIGGFRWMFEAVKKFDATSNWLAFDWDHSCLGEVNTDILNLTQNKNSGFEVV